MLSERNSVYESLSDTIRRACLLLLNVTYRAGVIHDSKIRLIHNMIGLIMTAPRTVVV